MLEVLSLFPSTGLFHSYRGNSTIKVGGADGFSRTESVEVEFKEKVEALNHVTTAAQVHVRPAVVEERAPEISPGSSAAFKSRGVSIIPSFEEIGRV